MRTVLFIAALALVANPASAGKRAKGAKDKKPQKVMVFVTEKAASKEIVAAVEEFCVKAEAFYGVGVWQKKNLKKRAGKCANPKCLAKLAKKKKLTTLVVGRAHPVGDGVRFAFQTIDVASKEATGEAELVVASKEEAAAEIARAYFGIAGITTPGYVTIANAPAAVNVDGKDVEVKEGKLELPPGPHRLRVADEEQAVMVLPKETREVEFASLAPPPEPEPEPVATVETVAAVETTESAEEPTEVAAVDELVEPLEPEPAVEETVESDGGGLGLLSWIGIGTAGAGVVALGVAAVFGSQTTVELGRDTTQLEARELNRDARSNATLANALLITGGALAIGGATLLAVDLFSTPTVAVTAAPSGDGAALLVCGRW